MEHGGKIQGMCQAMGVSQLPGQGERFVAPFQGLGWIAQKPQCPSRIDPANHPGIRRDTGDPRIMLLGVVQGNPLLHVLSGISGLSKIEPCPFRLRT
jgi:hypothetical protein